MKTVSMRMSRQSAGMGENLVVPNINWPRQCPCCGIEVEGGTIYRLTHMPALGVSPAGRPESAHLSWRVPVCGRCGFHFTLDKVVEVLLYLLPLPLWALAGYLLFLAGYEENVLAIVLWIIGGTALIGLAVLTWKLQRALAKAVLLRKSCHGVKFPVEMTSKYPVLAFKFEDDGYADKFQALNPGSSPPG